MKFNSHTIQKLNSTISGLLIVSLMSFYAQLPFISVAHADTVSNPTVTLNGANPMYINVGDDFDAIDLLIGGVTATPADLDGNGDWTCGAIRGGGNNGSWNVNSSASTTLTITYTVEEHFGPSCSSAVVGSTTVSRTLIIGDGGIVTPPPTLPYVVSAAPLTDITVPFGTELSSIVLPATTTVTLSDSTTVNGAPITAWTDGSYSSSTAATYTLVGTIGTLSGFTNTSNVTTSIHITVNLAPVICTAATSTLVSDLTDTVDGANAEASYIHASWTSSIPGATWIWKINHVQDPTHDETYTFTKTFNVGGTVDNATLEISADNNYDAYLNGHVIAGTAYLKSFQEPTKSWIVNPALFQNGVNTLSFNVRNRGLAWTDYTQNTAGLLYKFTYNASNCGTVGSSIVSPTIALIGANPLYVVQGTSFIDPGATAQNGSTDISSAIVRTGGNDGTGSYIDTSIISTTTLLYFVTNSDNVSASTTRVVIITPATTTATSSPTTVAPTITLNGSSTITLTVGDTFIDPSATATTTEAGHILSGIVVTGSVDTSVAGTTTLIYTVTDTTNGLTASTTRDVVVNAAATTTTPTDPATSTPPTNNGGGGSSGGGSIVPNFFSSNGSAGVSSINSIGLSCPFMTDYVYKGYANKVDQIRKLQLFLSTYDGNSSVTVNGILDDATIAGIKAFQAKHLADTMGPWHSNTPSGNVYITTLKEINFIVCNTTPVFTDAEQAIINAFIAGGPANGTPAAQTNTSTNTNGVNVAEASTGSTTSTTTAPAQGTDNTNLTGAAGQSGLLQSLWNWITSFFK